MIQQDEQHRHRPQAFEVRAKSLGPSPDVPLRVGFDRNLRDADAGHADGIVRGARQSGLSRPRPKSRSGRRHWPRKGSANVPWRSPLKRLHLATRGVASIL